jgi:site-specific DNA recombinase
MLTPIVTSIWLAAISRDARCPLLSQSSGLLPRGPSSTITANRRYRYYVCTHAQKCGRKECPAPSIPAGELERFVVEQIRGVGRDPAIVRTTVATVRRQAESRAKRLRRERGTLRRKQAALEADLGRLATAALPEDVRVAKLADVQDESQEVRRRLADVESEIATLESEQISESEIQAPLADFDGVWEVLQPREQARIIELLIESVVWDGEAENVSITFRPTGIKTLAASEREEAA